VLAVLNNRANAANDLRAHSLAIAAALLELTGVARTGDGEKLAEEKLSTGQAWTKFVAICEAQGGLREPPLAPLRKDWVSPRSGLVTHINNRKIARLAKLAGAPDDKAAGVELHARLGEQVIAGGALVTVHADNPGELAYALAYADANGDMFEIES
jgi:thymidine phosphorylase